MNETGKSEPDQSLMRSVDPSESSGLVDLIQEAETDDSSEKFGSFEKQEEDERSALVKKLYELPESAAAAPGEVVESAEFPLPDGRIVVMAPPRTAVAWRLPQILGEDSNNQILLAYGKALMYVRSVAGRPTNPVDKPTLQALANELGDAGTDMALAVYATYWPPFTAAMLANVKKNLRNS